MHTEQQTTGSNNRLGAPLAPARGFHLAVDEPVGLGIRRIMVEQVTSCLEALRSDDDFDEGVHRMRKSLKRQRAVLRLVRGELGRFRYREENAVLRDTARRWAAVRDGVVIVKVADSVVADTPHVSDAGAAELLGVLAERAALRRAAVVSDRQVLLDTLTTLLCFRCRVERFPTEGDDALPDRFGTVRHGLRRTARAAATAMHDALLDPTPEALHEWRKPVKYLRHQVELLEPVDPDRLVPVAKQLDQLGELLGDDHDLAVFGALLADEPDLLPDSESRHAVLATAESRRKHLQAEAFELGSETLGAPDALVDHLEQAWETAR